MMDLMMFAMTRRSLEICPIVWVCPRGCFDDGTIDGLMDEELFDELETEAKLSLAELQEHVRVIQDGSVGSSSIRATRMAQELKTKVDQKVLFR
jgi:hypothetical protein